MGVWLADTSHRDSQEPADEGDTLRALDKLEKAMAARQQPQAPLHSPASPVRAHFAESLDSLDRRHLPTRRVGGRAHTTWAHHRRYTPAQREVVPSVVPRKEPLEQPAIELWRWPGLRLDPRCLAPSFLCQAGLT